MLFERHQGGERAVLVSIGEATEPSHLAEFSELVKTAGGDAARLITGSRAAPTARYFIGSGKLEEVHEAVKAEDADVVIFNHALSPSQERNLEAVLCCRVLDRTRLILDIFAQRARTHEGKLQVELAQLEHMSTRLIRGWTHLERQKGGIGLRGPGETQLETDRRLLRGRIKNINARLAKVRSQREQGRRARKRAETPTIALVGYTNAGKSTLFNTLTQSKVYAADQLFATLDPTLRRLDLDNFGPIVLSDTVGFIKDLPHKLVQAFHATLEEAVMADLLIHVVDVADENRHEHIEEVHSVLSEIGAAELPILEVYNKIDQVQNAAPRIDYDEAGQATRVWLSAQTGVGIANWHEAVRNRLSQEWVHGSLPLQASEGKLRAKFYEVGCVVGEHYDDQGMINLEIKLPKAEFLRLAATEAIDEASLRPLPAA